MEAAIENQRLTAGAIEVRPREFLAMVNERPLNLTARELDLLIALVEREGRIVSREELYRAVWGEPYRKSDRSVDVYVGKLRQKLEEALPNVRFIHTHFGFGYRLQQEGPTSPRLGGPATPRGPTNPGAPSGPEPANSGLSHRFHIPETSP